jgi:polyhydroxyalkanoate synthesis repressor PhaR
MFVGRAGKFPATSPIHPDRIPFEGAQGEGMNKLRTIKKYANRRLYDLQVKRYITLDEIYDWVADGTEVKVIDKDRQEDVTCAVLFQVVAAHEHRLHPAMNVDFLRQAICSRADRSIVMTSVFLELSLRLFVSGELQHLVRAAAKEDPTQTVERLAAENYQRWCSARGEIFRLLANATSNEPSTEAQGVRPPGPIVLDDLDRRSRRYSGQPAVTAARK